ncbi:MAG: FadR family transcriptional regulator, partial [Acetobacteraceae bacterium]|nr:FadR family transcriptional regulator [Acetobacteraceae bacterium]
MDNGPAELDLPRAARARGDADRVRVALKRELRSDRWRDGEQLPTERALGQRYGVARNTVRRALQALEDEGFVIRHVGRGTFKAAGRAAPLLTPGLEGLDGASPADVLECRLAFEPELAPLIVARASQADLDRMGECLRGAEAAAGVAAFEAWDGALHDAFAVATHNQAVTALARALARVRLQAEWGELKTRSMTPERKALLDAEHRAIVEAIRRRDRGDTRARLREHIQHV